MRSFSLYSDCLWNGFSKTEELGKQLSFALCIYTLIFYKSNFMRTKPLILAKKIKKLGAKLRTKSSMLNIGAKNLG